MADIDENKIFFTEKQYVELEPKKNTGKILDIGGGGEAIIAQLYEEGVVSIDLSEEELKEAPVNEALKIIMDARDMDFLADQFEMVTSFFTLMYIDNEDLEKVFAEVKRVLKPNRSFLIWDLNIPPRKQAEEEIYAVQLEVEFKNQTIETGYGVRWQDKKQDMDNFIKIAQDNNFSVLEKQQGENNFYLELRNNK